MLRLELNDEWGFVGTRENPWNEMRPFVRLSGFLAPERRPTALTELTVIHAWLLTFNMRNHYFLNSPGYLLTL